MIGCWKDTRDHPTVQSFNSSQFGTYKWRFFIPNSSLIIDILYGCQPWQMEEDLPHFFSWVQTGGLSDLFLLKFLTSEIDSLMYNCCWLERTLGKWSNSTIDFDLDVWQLTCQITSDQITSDMSECELILPYQFTWPNLQRNLSSYHGYKSWGMDMNLSPFHYIVIFY